jgi:hypothetical protein
MYQDRRPPSKPIVFTFDQGRSLGFLPNVATRLGVRQSSGALRFTVTNRRSSKSSVPRSHQRKANHKLKPHRDQRYQGGIHRVGIEPLAEQNEKSDQRNQESDHRNKHEQITDNGNEQGLAKRAKQPHDFSGQPNDDAVNNHTNGKAQKYSDKVHSLPSLLDPLIFNPRTYRQFLLPGLAPRASCGSP